MNQPNPYAPPATDPSVVRMEVSDGSLWRMEDGRLLVHDHSSLPDVCIYGSSPEEPGKRRLAKIQVPRGWISLTLLVLTFVRVVLFPDNYGLLWLLGAATLTGLTARQVRIMVFEGRSALLRRRVTMGVTVLVLIGIIHIADDAIHLRKMLRSGILSWSGFWFLYGLGYWNRLRAIPKQDAWYEIRGIAASGLARLEQIQAQTKIPQDNIRDHMKR